MERKAGTGKRTHRKTGVLNLKSPQRAPRTVLARMAMHFAILCSLWLSPALAFPPLPALAPLFTSGLSQNAPLSIFPSSACLTVGNPVLPIRTAHTSRARLAMSSSSTQLAPEPEVHVANPVSANTFNAVFILFGPLWSLLSHATVAVSRAVGIASAPEDPVLSDVSGKVVVVTGASTGIGRQALLTGSLACDVEH